VISIVIPVYNEEQNLVLLQNEIAEALDVTGMDYEVLYIDDGSRDRSAEILRGFTQSSERIRLIQLSRHFGQTEAMQAGIDFSRGDILIFLDADRQNDPRDIPRLVRKIEEGFDVVSGWRRHRRDPFLTRRLPSYAANFLISQLTKVKLMDYGCSLKAYRRDVIKGIKLYSEMHRLVPIYASRQGASIAEIEVAHRKRHAGKAKYNLIRAHKVLLDLVVAECITNYFNKPSYGFGSAGLFCLFIGGGIGGIITIRKLFFGGVWVSPLLFIMVMAIITGLQFILMGILAEIFIRLYYRNTKETTYTVKKS